MHSRLAFWRSHLPPSRHGESLGTLTDLFGINYLVKIRNVRPVLKMRRSLSFFAIFKLYLSKNFTLPTHVFIICMFAVLECQCVYSKRARGTHFSYLFSTS